MIGVVGFNRLTKFHISPCIAEAKSLAAAQKHAKEALEIVFRGPSGGDVSVVGRFGANSGQAFVAISMPDPVNQIPVEAARKIAQDILSEAAIAEADGALVAFLMATLRRFRAQTRDDVPDEIKRRDDPTPAA